MKIRFYFVLVLLCSNLLAAKGLLTGTVVNGETGRAIVGANVVVMGAQAGASTDLDGGFRIVVKEGNWPLKISHVNYAPKVLESVIVFNNEETTIEIKCKPAAIEAEEVVIRATRQTDNENALLSSRKQSDVVRDGISSEQMKKSNDSNVAQALKRVTGVSIQNGKDIVVRGMGQRYSNVQLNGATMPSTNPDRREVPADLLSSSLVDHIVVQKTYTADQPGEFGGGSVQIHTREFPARRSLKIGLGTSWNSQSTGKDYLSYSGGGTDFLGYDDGTRQLPGDASRADLDGDGRMNSAEGRQAVAGFQNVWTPGQQRAPVSQNWAISWADRFEFSRDRRLGLSTSFSWNRSAAGTTGEYRNLFQPGALSSDYVRSSGSQKVGLSAMVNAFLKLGPNTQVGLRNLYVNQSEDKTTRVEGYYYNSDGDYRQDILKFVRRSMLSNSLELKQDVPQLRQGQLKVRAGITQTVRDEPDTRNTHYAWNNSSDAWEIVLSQRGNTHFFSEQHDRIAELESSFEFRPLRDLGLKAGFKLLNRDREFSARKFSYDNSGTENPYPQELRSESAETALSANMVEQGYLRFYESTRTSDSYAALQNRRAAWLSAEWNLSSTFEVNLGARVESDQQDLNGEILSDNTDLLPALNTTWRMTSKQTLRAALSMTVARPEFRELADFYFSDFIGGRTTYGNSSIERSRIVNADLRWEHYFGIGEVAAVGVFHKHFDKPIELRHRNSQQPEVVFDNVDQANLYGVELELRKNLLRSMQLSGNLTLIHSRVSYKDDAHNQANRERSLSGQSPYTLNLNWNWKLEQLDSSLNLAYNRFGRRISSVGSFNQGDDEFEMPFDQLDLVVTRQSGKWITRLAFSNLLNDVVEFRQSGIVTNRYSPGRKVSLGISLNL